MSKRTISDASSDSASSPPTFRAPQKAHINVAFGAQLFSLQSSIVVPTSPYMTVSELQVEAVRRVESLGVRIPAGDLVLHIGLENGPVAFGDDSLEDVVDLT